MKATAAASRGAQAATGLALAAAVVSGWLAVHVTGVFLLRLEGAAWWWLPPLVALQTWLGVGLFIVAHDAMHGSLAPGRPVVNAAVGQLCLGLYAGFSYRKLRASHHLHHAAPGTGADPDFHASRPQDFWPWFAAFFRRYFGVREFALLSAALAVHLLLGAHPLNLALCWGLPALLSAVQLFLVGTWLPHRHRPGSEPDRDFTDRHRTRSLPWPWLASLLACYHFGLHGEHHRQPHVPWWRLPAARAQQR